MIFQRRFKCVVCKKDDIKQNVGTRLVAICPDCFNTDIGYQKFLKWLYVRDRKMYFKEIQKGRVRFKDG